ncbi:GDSL-type esterase/lipase family protein [Tsukamurella sp. PLM1]|uniref:GDSL-type esterase/lipase family protein n=1 Tax=Tsukamurella sp. PLM1 TaxID=2929795 RepID=UPI0020C05BF2|nr:GDSL-type esterase/lipase family protein [Tsukamurella sp. PLM1]
MTVPARAPGRWAEYVALGDSRAAAPTRISLIRRADGRSGHGYPHELAALLRPLRFEDRSSVGATTEHLFRRGQVRYQGLRRVVLAPQGAALNAGTDLVTISIGGNDIRWHALIRGAFARRPGAAGLGSGPGSARRIDAALAGLGVRLTVALAEVRGRAPAATVLLVGHGGYYRRPGVPHSAAPRSELSLRAAAEFFDALDAVYLAACDRTGVRFVPVLDIARGHDGAARPAERWFEGNTSFSRTPARHPTALGSAALAAHLATTLTRAMVRP